MGKNELIYQLMLILNSQQIVWKIDNLFAEEIFYQKFEVSIIICHASVRIQRETRTEI